MSQARGGRDRGPAAGTPRWVKVSGLIALALALLLVLLLLLGGGEHGPGRHRRPADGEAPAVALHLPRAWR